MSADDQSLLKETKGIVRDIIIEEILSTASRSISDPNDALKQCGKLEGLAGLYARIGNIGNKAPPVVTPRVIGADSRRSAT